MQIVISDRKTGKSHSKKVEDIGIFLGKKIGEEIDITSAGLPGYKAKILGGSDKQGFPMNPSIPGDLRKKVFIESGQGFRQERKGERRRINVRGNTVSQETNQLNLAVTAYGEKALDELIEKTEKKEGKISVKEEMIKKSLDSAGDVKAAGEAKKREGEKVRR